MFESCHPNRPSSPLLRGNLALLLNLKVPTLEKLGGDVEYKSCSNNLESATLLIVERQVIVKRQGIGHPTR